jgi:hypothetical protein
MAPDRRYPTAARSRSPHATVHSCIGARPGRDSGGSGATILTGAYCNPATGGGQSGDTNCAASVAYGEQSIRTRARVSAAYGSASGSASVSALWGTAAAGGASFVAEFTDRVTVTVLGDTPIYAVFYAPLVTGTGFASFGKINEFDVGLKRASVSSTSFLSVSTPSASFSSFGSITQTWQQSPDGYAEDRIVPEALSGRIELFSGQELTIHGRFGASADALGSANASIGAGGSFGALDTLRARSALLPMDESVPVAGMYWRGVTFETADGAPVSADSVLLQSASGTDWTLAAQPVPEPRSWALWALGLGVVATRMRRTRTRSETA